MLRRLVFSVALASVLAAGWVWWQNQSTPPPATTPRVVQISPLPPKVVEPPAAAPPTNEVQAPLAVIPPPAPVQTNPAPPPPVVKPEPVAPPPKPKPTTPDTFPRPVQSVFEAQLALARLGISSGSIDGLIGPQTRAALRAFQQKERLPVTGQLDAGTKERLILTAPAFTTYSVTTNDLARLQPLSSTWLGKSRQSALDYETVLEMVAEKSHSHPKLVQQLNPLVDWKCVTAGAALQLPDPACTNATKAAFAIIRLSERTLETFDASTNLLAHFPCSIAQRVEKRPVGELHTTVVIPNPDYTFNPEVFPESPEAQQLKTKLVLPPGPNNPVGVAWIGLDRPGYGIHGTPVPEQVGRTESHGCFRLANWDAERFLKLAWVGMPVYIEP